MAAVDQDGELDRARAADVVERVEGGADRPAGEQHVVDEDHDLAVDAAVRDVGVFESAGGPQPRSSRYIVTSSAPTAAGRPSTAAIRLADPAGQLDAAAGDAEQDDGLGALVALEDLVGDPGQGPGDVGIVEDLAAARPGRSAAGIRWDRGQGSPTVTSFPASLDGSLKDVGPVDSTSGMSG